MFIGTPEPRPHPRPVRRFADRRTVPFLVLLLVAVFAAGAAGGGAAGAADAPPRELPRSAGGGPVESVAPAPSGPPDGEGEPVETEHVAAPTAPAAPLPTAVAATVRRAAAEVPGLSVAVGAGGRVRWAQGFGHADLEHGAAVTPDTRVLVFSLAKAWTAAAGARLAERGELAVDRPVATWLPGLPPALAEVTPMQLATHRAGVRHYVDDAEALAAGHCATVADALPLFVGDPLLFAPGTGQAYSSWGYVLLSAVLEAAAGEPFPDLLSRLVLEPAGMTGVLPADPVAVVPGRAVPYARRDGAWAHLPGLDASCKWGAGGFLATPSDAARFYLALIGGELVGPAFRPLLLGTGDDGLHRFGGLGAGGRAFVLADPAAGWVVVLAANARAEDVAFAALAEEVATGLGLRSTPADG